MDVIGEERTASAWRERVPRRVFRRRRARLLAAVALVAVVVVAFGVTAGGGEPASSRQTESPLPDEVPLDGSVSGLGDAEVRWTTELEGVPYPRQLTVVAGELLVGGAGGRVLRLDPSNGEVLGTLEAEIGGGIGGPFAVTAQGVWTAYATSAVKGYARLDLATGRVLATADVGEAYAISAGAAGLWAATGGTGVAELDPVSGAVKRLVSLPFQPMPSGLWVTADSVWAQDPRTGTVMRIDPRSGAVTNGLNVLHGPGMLVGEDLWSYDLLDDGLLRFGVVDGLQRSWTPLAGDPSEAIPGASLSVADGDVYALSARSDNTYLLVRVDGTNGQLKAALLLEQDPLGAVMAAGEGSVFVSRAMTDEVQALVPPTH